MDSSRRSARLVPMVLSLLHGPPPARRGSPSDQAMEGDTPPPPPDPTALRAGRSHVPQTPAAGDAALGLRQPEDLTPKKATPGETHANDTVGLRRRARHVDLAARQPGRRRPLVRADEPRRPRRGLQHAQSRNVPPAGDRRQPRLLQSEPALERGRIARAAPRLLTVQNKSPAEAGLCGRSHAKRP